MILDALGLAIAGGDAVLKIYSKIEDYVEAKAELEDLLPKFEECVQRIQTSLHVHFHGLPDGGIPGHVLGITKEGFQEIRDELERIKQKHSSRNKVRRTLRLAPYAEKVSNCKNKLESMEREVNLWGLIVNIYKGIQDRNKKQDEILEAVLKNQEILAPDGKHPVTIGNTSNCNYVSVPTTVTHFGLNGGVGKVNVANGGPAVTVQARELFDALSKSGIPRSTKLELALSEIARKVWEDWKVDPTDIEFERNAEGDKKRIAGAKEIFRASMKLRDDNNDVTMEEPSKVAVKIFVVTHSEAKERFPLFIREVYLQKNAQHPCIVCTFGGHWPTPEENGDGDDEEFVIEPYIVMERMTHNLRQAQKKGWLTSMDTKLRILGNVAEGIAHLHSRGIVHRDINLDNVLLRVIDGKIDGEAKICNFGLSRIAYKTDVGTDAGGVRMHQLTGPSGTSKPYIAPEAHSKSIHRASRTARDVWSFGVLICEVMDPEFLDDLNDDNPSNLSSEQELAEKTREKASIKLGGGHRLANIAMRCLSIDSKTRPRMEEVIKLISGVRRNS